MIQIETVTVQKNIPYKKNKQVPFQLWNVTCCIQTKYKVDILTQNSINGRKQTLVTFCIII